MGRGAIDLIRLWGSVFFTLLGCLTPQTMSSKDQNKTCNPSHCGIITSITHPFRLRDDPPDCGLPSFQLYCENNDTLLLHSGRSTYQVLGINYNNYTIRIRDAGIREGDCSSLPRHFLSRLNFTDGYGFIDDANDDHSYHASLGPESDREMTFDHVIYLNCSDQVRDDAGYVDTAACVDWGSRGEGEGHVYAVVGDLEAGRLKPECRVKSVAAIGLEWSSLLKGKNSSYDDIHRVLSLGFELSWWRQACSSLSCAYSEACLFYSQTQKVHCSSSIRSICYPARGVPYSRFCAFLAGIFEGLPASSEDMHYDSMYWTADLGSTAIKYNGSFISIPNAIRLGRITGRYVLPYIMSRLLFGILLLFTVIIYTYRRRHLSMYESIEDFIRLHNLHPIRYSYKDLKAMTKGFKTMIGEGGFATVYKGKLRSGPDVAVKMLGKKSKATGEEFINEVATIGRIHHFNVVNLVGFSVEGKKRALIYEFMPKGSLDKHIFLKKGHVSLSYSKIYEISLGVARGIAYLHHGCNMKILHFDIKPNNILLDDNLTPKISDFGLAKLYATDDSIATLTAAQGTLGYMAPELFYKNIGKVSNKTDVYSFGKLLMEMASRRRNINPHAEHSSQVYFPSWIYDQFDEEKDVEIADNLTEEEKALAKKMLIVALWCIQFNPTDRPSMNKVIEMLEADDVSSLEMPPKPSIYPENDLHNFDQTASSFAISSHDNTSDDSRLVR